MSMGGAHPQLHEVARKLRRGLVNDVGMAGTKNSCPGTGVTRPTVAGVPYIIFNNEEAL